MNGFLYFMLLALVATVMPTPAPAPPPVYEMTQAEYDATVAHRNALAAERNARLAQQKTALVTAGQAEDANAKLVPELQANIKILNSDLASAKRQDLWDRWKFSFVGIFLGAVLAIATFIMTKIGIFGASVAARLGIKAALAAIVLAGVTACSKSGAPVTWHGVTLTQGCLADAVQCYNEVGAGVQRNVLLIRYTTGGVTYGHAMCVYAWPGEGKPGNVWYAYDANHASFPLPQKLDARDPVAVAKFCIPGTVSAWYTIPDSTQNQ